MTIPRRSWHWVISVGLTVFVLGLLVSRVSLREAARALRHVDPTALAVAVAAIAVSIFLRAWRWSLLFPRGVAFTVRRAWAPTSIGLFVNGLLPGRLGDVARISMVKRREGIPVALVAATALVDRLLDALVLVLLLATAVLALPTTESTRVLLSAAGRLMLVSLAICGVVLPLASVRVRERVRCLLQRRVAPGRFPRVESMLDGVASGLEFVRSPRRLAVAAGVSVAVWGPHAVANLVVARTFPLTFTFATALIFTAFTVASTLVPSTPGSFGLFEGAGVLALRTAGATSDDATALAYAFSAHLVSYGTVMLTGVFVVLTSGWRVSRLGSVRPTAPQPPNPDIAP